MGRKARPKQTNHHLAPQPSVQERTLHKVCFRFLQSPPECQHLLPALTMLCLKQNMESPCSHEICGFLSVSFPALPGPSTAQSSFSASFPRAELPVLQWQDYTAKRETWVQQTCNKYTENQRKDCYCREDLTAYSYPEHCFPIFFDTWIARQYVPYMHFYSYLLYPHTNMSVYYTHALYRRKMWKIQSLEQISGEGSTVAGQILKSQAKTKS